MPIIVAAMTGTHFGVDMAAYAMDEDEAYMPSRRSRIISVLKQRHEFAHQLMHGAESDEGVLLEGSHQPIKTTVQFT